MPTYFQVAERGTQLSQPQFPLNKNNFRGIGVFQETWGRRGETVIWEKRSNVYVHGALQIHGTKFARAQFTLIYADGWIQT